MSRRSILYGRHATARMSHVVRQPIGHENIKDMRNSVPRYAGFRLVSLLIRYIAYLVESRLRLAVGQSAGSATAPGSPASCGMFSNTSLLKSCAASSS